MLTIYLIAFGLGGTLVAASLLMSGHSELELDGGQPAGFLEGGAAALVHADIDAHAHTGAGDSDLAIDVDHGVSGLDAALAWLPITSVRFWTFFLAFFGLTGTALTLLQAIGSVATVGLCATAVGYLSGLGMVKTMKHLRESQIDSSVAAGDFIGANATVVQAVGQGRVGKVRFMLKGRQVELLADTEDDTTFEVKSEVLVYRVTDDGHAMITRTQQLSE